MDKDITRNESFVVNAEGQAVELGAIETKHQEGEWKRLLRYYVMLSLINA